MGFSQEEAQELKKAKLFELTLKEPEKAQSVIVAIRRDKDGEIVFGGTLYNSSLNLMAIVDKYLEMFSEKIGVGYSEAAEMLAATIKKMGKDLDTEVGKNGIQ